VVQNLVSYDAHHLEALLAADRVDDHVAMNANEVLGVKNAVLVLAGGIDHLDGKVMVAVADDFAESVFDGRVVRVDKVPVDVLYCEGGFACARVVLLEREGTFSGLETRVGGREAYQQIYCRRWPSCAVSAEEACCCCMASLIAWCNGSVVKGVTVCVSLWCGAEFPMGRMVYLSRGLQACTVRRQRQRRGVAASVCF
jgi:hypothetical protein